MAVHALIFDLDGTLIDSSEGVVDATNYALRQMRETERSAEEIKRYIGFPLKQMFADFTSASADALYDHFQVRAAETVVASAHPLDGVDAVLSEVHKRGIRMSIATTKTRGHLDGIIAKLGWTKYFPTSVSGSDVAAPKPDPEAFTLALQQLNCNAASALVVGDTINDILAARRVPVKVAAVRSPYGGHEDVAALQPDYSLNNLRELLRLLPV
ncbi:hypothetical protein C3F09_12160 [candidate division GN15 bacterium]|uniref:HAD family hydrolase n=1 Tax=candidate division GN15 bacterium TaxID=2072418 RepID=A0A855X239_9BACT|nr:MAG: hypothetical protein C3F09_12160 [candidate division GN15 bacterium]